MPAVVIATIATAPSKPTLRDAMTASLDDEHDVATRVQPAESRSSRARVQVWGGPREHVFHGHEQRPGRPGGPSAERLPGHGRGTRGPAGAGRIRADPLRVSGVW